VDHPFAVHRPRPAPGRPPVWLLHGVFTDHRLWSRVWPALPGLDVVALDGPGHGTAPHLDPLPSLDDQVPLLAALLRDRADGRVLLAGHSWGGMLAARLAARHPELVAGLLLANTPLLATRGPGFALQRALLAAGLPLGTYGRQAARALFGSGHRRDHPAVTAATAAAVRALGRRGTRQLLARVLVEPGDAVDVLARVTAPTVLVAGTDDYVNSAELRTRLTAAGHELRTHPGGHMGPAEAPLQLADALRGLVARTAAS
jgi:3-oxoadipate enol-lactonase